MNNQLVAASEYYFWNGAHLATIGYDENGVPVPLGTPVWTASFGMASPQSCDTWTNPFLGGGAIAGDATADGSGYLWIDYALVDCNSSLELYGISQ